MRLLTLVVIGDHCCVASVRRVDKRRNSARLTVFAQQHRPQIKPYRVRRRQHRPQLVVNLDLFLGELEIFGVELNTLLHQ